MAEILSVPFSAQQQVGYCLPACLQMVLTYLGIERVQADLARDLGMVEDFGIPASHITRLRARLLLVIYQTEGSFLQITEWLSKNNPVIAFIQTEHLRYWNSYRTQHAVVVVAIDETFVYLLDPAFDAAIIKVPKNEFFLAWDEMELAFAVIQKRTLWEYLWQLIQR